MSDWNSVALSNELNSPAPAHGGSRSLSGAPQALVPSSVVGSYVPSTAPGQSDRRTKGSTAAAVGCKHLHVQRHSVGGAASCTTAHTDGHFSTRRRWGPTEGTPPTDTLVPGDFWGTCGAVERYTAYIRGPAGPDGAQRDLMAVATLQLTSCGEDGEDRRPQARFLNGRVRVCGAREWWTRHDRAGGAWNGLTSRKTAQ
jgi:hypothetical protein